MLIDFHSHLTGPDSIVCTADASMPDAGSLLRCAGLLPDKWTEERQKELFSLLEQNPELQLGEVGLDRRFENILPMERQIAILREEMAFAINGSRCISIHCVHATKPMIDILRELNYRPYSILWHGFTGSPETARELSKLNVILSIGPRFQGNIEEILQSNPYSVPETDYEGSDILEHRRILESRYQRFPEGYSGKAEVIFKLFRFGQVSQ